MTEPAFPPTVGVSSTNPKDMPAGHAAIPVWNAENWLYEGKADRDLARSIAAFIQEMSSAKPTVKPSRAPEIKRVVRPIDVEPHR